MKEKSFRDARGREVLIKIDDEAVCFYHADNIRNQEHWVQLQLEGGYEVTEEEKKVDEFYWVDTDRWIKDGKRLEDESGFHSHMKRKNWFTNEMYEFINECCQ